MKRPLTFVSIAILGCAGSTALSQSDGSPDAAQTGEAQVKRAAATASHEQEKEIRELIEKLVITEKEVLANAAEDARSAKVRAEAEKNGDQVDDPFGTVDIPPEVLKELQGYHKTREDAFDQLTAFKDLAFPILAEHLEDARPSVKVWNHIYAKTVGAVCYRVIHNQLMELPPGYSEYGLQRTGRDGEGHIKPYWEPEPYADSDGLANWLRLNEGLTYTEKRIKCLAWLLDGEKKIGVIDPDGYYTHIFALELEILKQKAAMGKDVADELARALILWESRPANQVPKELLPDGPLPEIEKKHAEQETSAMLGSCPDGHSTLRDVPILHGTFPVQTKDPAEWSDEDKALAARRDAKEVILGGEFDSAEDPRFQSMCLTCDYRYITMAVPDVGANWFKRGRKFADFTTSFSQVARSLPFAGMTGAEILVEVNHEKKVVSETVEITVPSSRKAELVGKIEAWCDENHFDRSLIHLETPLYPRGYEQHVEKDDVWFYIKVHTDPKKETTFIRFHLWRWDF
jgi:hypothetical protein